MQKYLNPARVGWTWEPIPAQRFRPFSTVQEKILLTVCGMGMLILFVFGGR